MKTFLRYLLTVGVKLLKTFIHHSIIRCLFVDDTQESFQFCLLNLLVPIRVKHKEVFGH